MFFSLMHFVSNHCLMRTLFQIGVSSVLLKKELVTGCQNWTVWRVFTDITFELCSKFFIWQEVWGPALSCRKMAQPLNMPGRKRRIFFFFVIVWKWHKREHFSDVLPFHCFDASANLHCKTTKCQLFPHHRRSI